MQLLILKLSLLLTMKFNKMFNKVKEISWRDVVKFLCSFHQPTIELDDRFLDVDNSCHNYVRSPFRMVTFFAERVLWRINCFSELFSNLIKSF